MLPWCAPEAEPGAVVSSSHAASETPQSKAASGSAAVAGWGVTPAAVASHGQQGPPRASSSWGLFLGLKAKWAPGPQEPLTSHRLEKPKKKGVLTEDRRLAHWFGNKLEVKDTIPTRFLSMHQ